jgi:inhibitor of cysteine peptidase
MKIIRAVLLFFILSPIYAMNNKPMVIILKPAHTQFRVVLPANPTTGYQWTLHNYNKSLLRLVSSQFNRPNSTLIGAGGSAIFTFQVIPGAITPSVTALVFSYARPWEPQKGTLQTVTVRFQDTPVMEL